MGTGPPPPAIAGALAPAWPRIIPLVNRVLDMPGVVLTSWWRSPAENAAVRGNPRSQHLLGLAWDVVPASPWIAAAFQQLGFQAILEGDHVHAQVFPAGVIPDWFYRRFGL